MTTLLLIIIYIAFISLGLPDSILGAAWPVMQGELGLPLAGAGLVSMIVSGSTIISSLFSGMLIRRMGTGKLTLVSVLMTALALLGYSFSQDYLWLCLIAFPLGLGAGAVDAALNDFVARNFAARHMNWLHSFWGMGATTGPLIMAFMLNQTGRWQMGYRTVAIVQFTLVALLAISLPLWRRFPTPPSPQTATGRGKAQRIRGMTPNLVAFFAYCAVEASTGLWAASFLVEQRGLSSVLAAGGASAYYLGITLGRFLNGFLSSHFDAKNLIRGGQAMILLGIGLMFLPYIEPGRSDAYWPGLRAYLSNPVARNPAPLWRGKLSQSDGHTDGNRLCWSDAHAAVIGTNGRSIRSAALSVWIAVDGIAANHRDRAVKQSAGRAEYLTRIIQTL